MWRLRFSLVAIETRKPVRAHCRSPSAMSALKFPSSLSRIMCKFVRTNTRVRERRSLSAVYNGHHLQFAVVLVVEQTNRVTRFYTRINIVQGATQPAIFYSQFLFFQRGYLIFVFRFAAVNDSLYFDYFAFSI